MQSLHLIALEYRSVPAELVSRIDDEKSARTISQFAVWLLDSSIDTLRFDWQRDLYQQLRELHLRRSNGEVIDFELWESLQADGLAGTKLWPPEWLCASCFPAAPPLARTASAIALSQWRLHRLQPGNPSYQINRDLQAEALRRFLSG